MLDLRPVTIYVTNEQWAMLASIASEQGIALADAVLERATTLYQDRVRDLEHEYGRAEAAEAEASALRAEVERLRATCENVLDNMQASGEQWSSWHTKLAIARLRDALDKPQNTP